VELSPEVFEGSPSLFAVAVSGSEQVKTDDPELHGYLKPRPPADFRYGKKGGHPQINEIGRWKDRPGMPSEKKSKHKDHINRLPETAIVDWSRVIRSSQRKP
jgi:hypothetical protein